MSDKNGRFNTEEEAAIDFVANFITWFRLLLVIHNCPHARGDGHERIFHTTTPCIG
ncbi:hypothetical protein GIC22_20130 [Salmonella enterica]|nr:hypothetical protein [Salmonella enterica]